MIFSFISGGDEMEEYFPTLLLDLLVISATFSVILMALIQKFKTLSFINKSWQLWIIHLIFSFTIGIPFAMIFYNINIYDSIWVGLFSFVGASTIYDTLKNQNIFTYKPSSLNKTKSIPIANEIKREK